MVLVGDDLIYIFKMKVSIEMTCKTRKKNVYVKVVLINV